MKYAILATALTCFYTPLFADTLPLRAPVTSATLYSQGATLIRAVPFSAPAGSHELLITNLPEDLDPLSVRVGLDGAKLGAVTVRHSRVLPYAQEDSPELVAAKAALEAAETKLRDTEDTRADVLMKAEATRARLDYLATLQGPTESAASPETLAATLDFIGKESLAAQREMAAAQRDARRFEKDLEALRDAVADAQQTVDALSPSESDNAMLSIAISADADTEGVLTLTHFVDSANWIPAYDVHLANGDTPSLHIERGAFIQQYTDEDWTNVAITLSTSRPDEQAQPSDLFPWRRRIEKEQPVVAKSNEGRLAEMDLRAAAPMAEPVLVEEAAYNFGDGITATYVYPAPVSLTSDAEAVRLSLGALTLTPQTYALANPMRDTTAFLMAEATNETGELILPSPEANFYLNETYIGQQEMPLIAAGDQIDFSFGPINGLRLNDTVTKRVTGDRGVISTRNEQSETRTLSAENLTDQSFKLRMIGRVPYSEQEDLVITHQATPSPTQTNFEDQRGIMMWEQTLAAGETFDVDLSHQIQWPQDMMLR